MTYEEIAKLGSLVNVTVSEAESRDLIPNMESVLGYIDQIQNVTVSLEKDTASKDNPRLRPDVASDSDFHDDFMNLVPEKENGYVKVPQVLDK